MTRTRSPFRILAALGCVAALSACQMRAGEDLLDDELTRVKRLKGFDVVSVDHHRAVIAAKGREVVIEAAKGFCITKDSLETSSRAAFALIADCVTEIPLKISKGASGDPQLRLPPSFPGLMTVAISDASVGGDLDGVERFLKSDAAKPLLARGLKGGTAAEVIASRRMGRSIYLHLEDQGAKRGLFSARFWRALVSVKDRLVLVTVSGFRDRPITDDDMLAFLALQVTTLRDANGAVVAPEERQLAARVGGRGTVLAVADAVEGDADADDGPPGALAPEDAPRPPFPARVGKVRVEVRETPKVEEAVGGDDTPLPIPRPSIPLVDAGTPVHRLGRGPEPR